MSSDESRIRWPELVRDVAKMTSRSTLASRLYVTAKEVNRWIKGKARPQGDNARKILDEAQFTGVNWRKYVGVSPVYDFAASFEKNVANGPQGLPEDYDGGMIPNMTTQLFSYTLNSPIGVPASVLTINSKWIAPLTRLGFDILTYKTVRSRLVRAHPYPNVVYLPEVIQPFVVGDRLNKVKGAFDLPFEEVGKISMANSFGMPSCVPEEWQADMQAAKRLLRPGQILVASVVGTVSDADDDLVGDFVHCARLAHEVSPHVIELNFSCPNVYEKAEGSVYHDPDKAGQIVKRVRNELPDTIIVAKLGYLQGDELTRLFDATYRYVDGYTAINTQAAKIIADGLRCDPIFSGSARAKAGISGVAIREYACDMVRRLTKLAAKKPELTILGVGGISSAEDVRNILDAGAKAALICTAAFFNPYIAVEIRKQLASPESAFASSKFLARSGLSVPFHDRNIAGAFDLTLEVSAEMRVPFERVFGVVQKRWLTGYMQDLANSQESSASPIKNRRGSPSLQEIREWVRSELKNH